MPRPNMYKCRGACGKYKYFNAMGDPQKNEFYMKNSGLRDCFCKKCRLLNNKKYRAPLKGRPKKKIKPAKHLNQIYAEIGRCKLAGAKRGTTRGFTEYFSQRQGDFKDIYHIDYSEANAEKTFKGMM